MTPHSFREALDAFEAAAADTNEELKRYIPRLAAARLEVERLYALRDRVARSVNDPTTFNVIVDIEGERFVPEQRALDAESRLLAARVGEEYVVADLSEDGQIAYGVVLEYAENGRFRPGDRVYVTKGEAG